MNGCQGMGQEGNVPTDDGTILLDAMSCDGSEEEVVYPGTMNPYGMLLSEIYVQIDVDFEFLSATCGGAESGGRPSGPEQIRRAQSCPGRVL